MITSTPVLQVDLMPIEGAIRKERTRLSDIEFETGATPSTWLIEYMCAERARGILTWPTNF